MLLTLTLDFSFEKDRIIKATKERVAVLAKADFLSPSQRELAVQLAVISIFPLVWSRGAYQNSKSSQLSGYVGTGEPGRCREPPTTHSFGSAEAMEGEVVPQL
jgi:hypothetical protein